MLIQVFADAAGVIYWNVSVDRNINYARNHATFTICPDQNIRRLCRYTSIRPIRSANRAERESSN